MKWGKGEGKVQTSDISMLPIYSSFYSSKTDFFCTFLHRIGSSSSIYDTCSIQWPVGKKGDWWNTFSIHTTAGNELLHIMLCIIKEVNWIHSLRVADDLEDHQHVPQKYVPHWKTHKISASGQKVSSTKNGKSGNVDNYRYSNWDWGPWTDFHQCLFHNNKRWGCFAGQWCLCTWPPPACAGMPSPQNNRTAIMTDAGLESDRSWDLGQITGLRKIYLHKFFRKSWLHF